MAAAAIPAVIAGGQAVSSGIKGRRAARRADKQQQQTNAMYQDMLGMGREQMNTITNAYNSFADPSLRADTRNAAYEAARTGRQVGREGYNYFQGNDRDLNSASGIFRNLDLPDVINRGDFNAPDLERYGFQGARNTARQAARFADEYGDRARSTALERQAESNTGALSGLDAAMASRGMSGNSGVAAAAAGDVFRGGAQSMSELNRGLADQQAQQVQQASQFDASMAQQWAGLESQYNLGYNQLAQNSAANAYGLNLQKDNQTFNMGATRAGLDLQRGQGLMNTQGMRDNRMNQALGYKRQGAMDAYQVLQNAYSTNSLAPQMQALSQLNPTGLMQMAAGGMGANNAMAQEAVGAAGQGFGQSLADFGQTLPGAISAIGGLGGGGGVGALATAGYSPYGVGGAPGYSRSQAQPMPMPQATATYSPAASTQHMNSGYYMGRQQNNNVRRGGFNPNDQYAYIY